MARKRDGDTPDRPAGAEARPQPYANVQGQATRAAVLDTAGELFAARGYAATSMRHIAESAGVGPSLIMYHFQSKENLFLETIRHFIVDRARLDRHFTVFDELDYNDPQAVSDAIRDAVRSFIEACHGPTRTPHVTGLYVRVMVEGDRAALAMLLQCFAGVQKKLPQILRSIRPDLTETDIAFWMQLFWSQLQYTVMGEKLILYDMQLGDHMPPAFLDESAWRFAYYCALPLGLPEPTRYK